MSRAAVTHLRMMFAILFERGYCLATRVSTCSAFFTSITSADLRACTKACHKHTTRDRACVFVCEGQGMQECVCGGLHCTALILLYSLRTRTQYLAKGSASSCPVTKPLEACVRVQAKGSTTRVTVMHKAKVKGANHHARPSQRPQQKHTHLSLEDTLGRTVAVERHQRLLQEHSQVDGFTWRHALQRRRNPSQHHVVVAGATPKPGECQYGVWV